MAVGRVTPVADPQGEVMLEVGGQPAQRPYLLALRHELLPLRLAQGGEPRGDGPVRGAEHIRAGPGVGLLAVGEHLFFGHGQQLAVEREPVGAFGPGGRVRPPRSFTRALFEETVYVEGFRFRPGRGEEVNRRGGRAGRLPSRIAHGGEAFEEIVEGAAGGGNGDAVAGE